jgi:hypothetical protein
MPEFVGFGWGLVGGAGFLGAVAVGGPSCGFCRAACLAESILNLNLKISGQKAVGRPLQSLLWLECLSEPRVHHLHKLPPLNTLYVVLNVVGLLAFEGCDGRVDSTSKDNIRCSIDAGRRVQTQRRCSRQLSEMIRSAQEAIIVEYIRLCEPPILEPPYPPSLADYQLCFEYQPKETLN